MIVFHRWWFIVCLTIAGAAALQFFGFFAYLLASDVSYLSFVSISIFTLSTLFVGQLTYAAVNKKPFEKHLGFCWFASECMLGLGMMGTLIGFLILLSTAFIGMDLTNTIAMQKTLGVMGAGFATAGLTTLVGLCCSLLLKLQLVNLEYLLEE